MDDDCCMDAVLIPTENEIFALLRRRASAGFSTHMSEEASRGKLTEFLRVYCQNGWK